MKRKKIFVVCIYCVGLIIPSQLYSQKTEYQSVFGETNTSFNFYNNIQLPDALCVRYADSAYFVKDTIINSIEYKKFEIIRRSELYPEQNNRHLGIVFLRENEDYSKLYCVYPNDENTEVLLMDLNLNLQDEVYLGGLSVCPYTVDQIFYDDENIKHIILVNSWFDCNCYPCGDVKFIEGVGPTLFFQVENNSECLVCAFKDLNHYVTINLWGVPWTECFYESGIFNCGSGIDDVFAVKNNLKIFPNPAYSFIEIDLEENFTNYQSLLVYDLLGKPCLNIVVTEEKQHVDIQNLPVGIYIIKAIGKDKLPLHGKFSIMR